MNIIPIKDHPHNLDKTAAIVWSESNLDTVYRVRAGFVAVNRFGALAETFPTMSDAVSALHRYSGSAQ